MQAAHESTLLKASKLSTNIHLKLATASCGTIQVFFIVLYAQYIQITFISARRLRGPKLLIQCFVSRGYGHSGIFEITRLVWRNARRKKKSSRHLRVSSWYTKHKYMVQHRSKLCFVWSADWLCCHCSVRSGCIYPKVDSYFIFPLESHKKQPSHFKHLCELLFRRNTLIWSEWGLRLGSTHGLRTFRLECEFIIWFLLCQMLFLLLLFLKSDS